MSVSKTTTKFGLPLPQPGDKPDWYDVGAASQQIEDLAGTKNGFATLDANGNAVQMPANAVPQTRTLAGLDLSKDRTLAELTAAGLGASNPNLLINGDFKVNQRGLEQYEYGYGFDRWVNVFTNANLISQVTRGMYNGNGGKYSIRISILSVSNSDGNNFAQPIEDSANGMSCFAGQTVTFSISASTSSNCSYRCMYIGYKETPTATNMTYKITAIPALGGNRYSVTATLPITACKVECGIGATRSINATDANSYIDIWDAKLEIGSVATPFVPHPYAEELAMCQRYFQCFGQHEYHPGEAVSSGENIIIFGIPFQYHMRDNPTFSCSPMAVQVNGTNSGDYVDNVQLSARNITPDSLVATFPNPNSTKYPGGSVSVRTDGYYSLDAEIY